MSRETILVVDDNPENLTLMTLLLCCEDFTVRTAGGAREALKDLSVSVPDGLLTDIQMPEIDGLELIRRVRRDSRTSGIPILAVSANALKENIREAHDAGCDAYLTKPLETRTFAASVREHLKRGRDQRTAQPGPPALDLSAEPSDA